MDKAYTRLPDKENCYGCFACVNRCSANAIRMIPDHEGFLYPCVDDKKCTNCGECLRVCPSLCKTSTKKRSKSIVAFARKYSERVYSKSSSGGIFPILAKKVLSNKGIVVGAAFNNRWDVEHISIEDAVELSKLRGSKYVQSRIGDMYSYVKKMLVDNRTVLFVGTPCQVAGLKAFLGFDYNNLITVDLICKGVPSPLVWNKYLDEFYDRRSIVDINFRDKIYGWSPPLTISFTLKNGKTIRKNSKSDSYMRAFLKSLSLRPSCYRCKYKSMNRVSDISLGDFWGVGKCWGIVNDEKGISLVLVNTNKGYGLYKSIRSELKVNKRISHRKSVIKNKALTTGLEPHPSRELFFSELGKKEFNKLVDICLKDKCDCLILSWWFNRNYGSILTAYALQEAVKRMGLVVRTINYKLNWFKSVHIADEFAKDNIDLTEKVSTKAGLQKLNRMTDTFIVGSDQVWRYKPRNIKEGTTYFLDFVGFNKKRIAYAASFGREKYDETDEMKIMKIKYYLDMFSFISVREDDGVEILDKTFNIKSDHVLDPVFLLESEDYRNLARRSTNNNSSELIGFFLSPTDEKIYLLEYVAKELQLEKSCFSSSDYKKISVYDYLNNIMNCKMLITDSFHGVCFAIIFNKPFICLPSYKHGSSRVVSLLKKLELSCRYLNNPLDIFNRKDLLDDYSYKKTNHLLYREKERSIKWLENALKDNTRKARPDIVRLLSTKLLS